MKTVLITGASKGIGAEIARTLAKEGYNVAINFNKSESAAVALKNELEKYACESRRVEVRRGRKYGKRGQKPIRKHNTPCV